MKKTVILPLIMVLISSCDARLLPKPRIANNLLGEMFGLDARVNHDTIDKYLFRKDSVYRDMRMLIDPANYEAIGGDRFLSGFVAGFEAVPLPLIVPVNNTLPPEVGESYSGPTLFAVENNRYVPLYHESLDIIEYLFPKDKNIMLMCGGAGYAGEMRSLLLELGWDAKKVYNTGGYWYYEGKHNVQLKRVNNNGDTVYDFYKVSYHDFDFTTLMER